MYAALADVYEWLVPVALLTPEWTVDAFAPAVAELPAGARVLDCACGTGQLAVGLALRGFDVSASDASPHMVRRTSALAAERNVDVPAVVCRWEGLGRQSWDGAFDAVFCVGNSLAHSRGREARQAALRGMAAVLRPGGRLVLTARNFEQIRAEPYELKVFDHIVVRDGRPGLVIYSWWVAEDWEDMHEFDVAVALIGEDGAVVTPGERLQFWPFRHETLDEDLRAAGLTPASSTWRPDAERYMVTARAAER
jgi:SAM-dependent methyltransferase